MKHFLIIQTAFLGDVILCTPVISELSRIYPEAKIDVVVRKGNESLLSNNPYIHQLFIWNKKEGKYRSLVKTIKQLRQNRYDEVINLQRYSSSAIMTFFTKSKMKIGFSSAAMRWVYHKVVPHSLSSGKHEVTRNLSTIQHHGAKDLVRPEMFPSEADFEFVQNYKNQPYYCLAPASVWFTKQLPKEKWIELLTLLETTGKVYLLGGPDDLILCDEIANEKASVEVLAGKLNLLQSAALMRDAKMNYVNDSGPLHIASAMNASVRAFFCSTIPNFGFGPLSDDSKVIQTSENLSCKPCGNHGFRTCPKGHFKCGYQINVADSMI
jgi:lipopolysaccharide heptosyltransferase II